MITKQVTPCDIDKIPRVVVQASKDRKAVSAWADRPLESDAIMSALESVAKAVHGAQVLAPDFRFNRDADNMGWEYSFGKLGEIRFPEAQQPQLLAKLVRHIGKALVEQGCEVLRV
jgi:hypothetical protein